jgi:4-hydroxybenzoate polyprenyltransferase
MWQRIQTLYMAVGALSFFSTGMYHPDNKQALIAGLGVALLLANITYFKYRKRQFVVNRIAIIVAFVLEVIIIYPLLTKSESSSHLNYSLVAPLVSVIFCSLANRAIQRDEKKVNSSDRFR